MNLLDRQFIRNYLKAYLVCLTSLLSLYIVVDLFLNVDEFLAQNQRGLGPVLKLVGTYYGYKISQIFDLMCEAVVLLAAMFTVALMQRSNELLPLLSAGVSTQRVVRPILWSACAMLALTVLNKEILIPQIGTYLLLPRNDPKGEKLLDVHGAFEPNGIHIEGREASRRERVVYEFACLIPENISPDLIHLFAEKAYYFPPSDDPHSGGWLLTRTTPAELPTWHKPEILEVLDSGKYFLHVREVDFDVLTRNRTWFIYASTARLLTELNKPDSLRLASMAVVFHMRLTRPILGLLLVYMGLSVILRDQNRNVFISTGLCLVMCAVFFAAIFTCKHLGDNDYLSPALAAWLPVLCFGPLAFVLFDAIHT